MSFIVLALKQIKKENFEFYEIVIILYNNIFLERKNLKKCKIIKLVFSYCIIIID